MFCVKPNRVEQRAPSTFALQPGKIQVLQHDANEMCCSMDHFISQAKRPKKKSSKVRWPWLRPGIITFHNSLSFSKYDLHLKCSSLIFQFPINPINLAHFGRSLPDVLATCEAFDTVGKHYSIFIILRSKDVIKTSEFLFQRIRSNC